MPRGFVHCAAQCALVPAASRQNRIPNVSGMMRREGRSSVASFLSPNTLWNRTSANVLKPLSANRAPMPPVEAEVVARFRAFFIGLRVVPAGAADQVRRRSHAAGKREHDVAVQVQRLTSGPELFPDRLLYMPSMRKPSGVLAVPEIASVPSAWNPVDVASPRSPTGTVAPAAKPNDVRRWPAPADATQYSRRQDESAADQEYVSCEAFSSCTRNCDVDTAESCS